LVTNAQDGGIKQGGSTLTQQYVRNLLVENAKTDKDAEAAKAPNFGRKLRELRYAVNVEKRLTKAQILEGYLNIAYFGSGAYGVQAASQYYFSKNATQLTLPEAALLAGVTNSPYFYDPEINPKGAADRRNTVLYRMAELKIITKHQADAAAATQITLHIKKPKTDCVDSKAPFFCEYVKDEILGNPAFGKTAEDRTRLLYRGGLTIRTTLNMKAQKAAQHALDLRPSSSKTATEAMVKPGTGEIKAMVVSKDYGDHKSKGQTTLNLAADYAHGGNGGYSAGSTFKIFTLATALDKGYGPGTTLPSPTSTTVAGFRDCGGHGFGPWSVRNAEPAKGPSANLSTGTWDSINTFYAFLEQRVGGAHGQLHQHGAGRDGLLERRFSDDEDRQFSFDRSVQPDLAEHAERRPRGGGPQLLPRVGDLAEGHHPGTHQRPEGWCHTRWFHHHSAVRQERLPEPGPDVLA
jgi:membrane peptidoglycan carboxypeptidase